MTTDTDKASDKLVEMALKAAFEKGWCAAAQWAQRDDLRHDTGSIAYAGQRDAILAGKAAEVRAAIIADLCGDVAGLMDVADRYALAQADPAHWRSALESDLRLALAAREDYVLQLLVAAGHVTQEKVDQARSIAAAAPKGTYPQEDRSREPPCHACGLGYKCRSANCPNTTPDPMTGPHRKEHHDQP